MKPLTHSTVSRNSEFSEFLHALVSEQYGTNTDTNPKMSSHSGWGLKSSSYGEFINQEPTLYSNIHSIQCAFSSAHPPNQPSGPCCVKGPPTPCQDGIHAVPRPKERQARPSAKHRSRVMRREGSWQSSQHHQPLKSAISPSTVCHCLGKSASIEQSWSPPGTTLVRLRFPAQSK